MCTKKLKLILFYTNILIPSLTFYHFWWINNLKLDPEFESQWSN